MDLGPQIAVWVETADRSRFVDTVMVTNLTARYGIGNRPGLADLPSGPRHPYGKRVMALPVWAHARGKLYPQVVMQDGKEEWMGFHESISSPDPYYCRPMGLSEVDVDAITCPTKVFNSAKGRLATERPPVPYPPRNDLVTFTDRDCDGNRDGACTKSSEQFSALNDLDEVAAPTPPFDRVFEGRWTVPGNLGAGDELALMVEVNREFDQNADHQYLAYNDRMLSDNGFTQTGLPNNLGQPSVVYRVPFKLDGDARHGSTPTIVGYGRPDGSSGELRAPDATISDAPGSGAGRLRAIPTPWTDAPAANGRVFVRLDECGDVDPMGPRECDPPPAPPTAVTGLARERSDATSATLQFLHGGDAGQRVLGYEIRLHLKEMTEASFLEGTPKAVVEPGAPGTSASFTLSELRPQTDYYVAVRAVGRCGTRSGLSQVKFTTSDQQFAQVTGCFIATAAYGSTQTLGPLRRVRDQARAGSGLGAALVDLYERASPPLADLLRNADAARAVVRQLLAPATRPAP